MQQKNNSAPSLGWNEMSALEAMDKRDVSDRTPKGIMKLDDVGDDVGNDVGDDVGFTLSDFLVPAAAGAAGTVAATATYMALTPKPKTDESGFFVGTRDKNDPGILLVSGVDVDKLPQPAFTYHGGTKIPHGLKLSLPQTLSIEKDANKFYQDYFSKKYPKMDAIDRQKKYVAPAIQIYLSQLAEKHDITVADTDGGYFKIKGGQKVRVSEGGTEVWGDDTATALAIGIPLAAVTAYGAYKIAQSLPANETPWLYKMNPTYWFKTAKEKEYINIEKRRGSRNVNLERELEAAKRAYATSTAAATQEASVSQLEAGLKGQGVKVTESKVSGAPLSFIGDPFVGPIPLNYNNLEFVHRVGTWLPPNPKRTKAIIARIRAAGDGQMITHGQKLDYNQAKALFEIVDGYFHDVSGSHYDLMNTERWMAEFVERRGITYTDHDGTVYIMKGKKRMPLNKKSAHSAVVGSVGPQAQAPNFINELRKANLPIDPGTTYTFDQNAKAAEVLKKIPGADKWFANFVERRDITWVDKDGTIKGYKSGRIYIAAPPAPMDVATRTRGPVVMGADQKISLAAQRQSPLINDIAKSLGLTGMRKWSAPERDNVTAIFLRQMIAGTGQKYTPGAHDAQHARLMVNAWAASHGYQLPPAPPITAAPTKPAMSGDEMGLAWYDVASLGLIPAAKAAWQGTKWVGRKIFGGGDSEKSPQERRMDAIRAAASARAASKARILAAEKAHEAAISEREAERDVARLEAKAADAEAAAQEAEKIAAIAEAEKGLRGTPQALEGWSVIGCVHPSRVGKEARAAASPTKIGAQIRMGAVIAEACRTNARVSGDVSAIASQAANGNKKAQAQLEIIDAGAQANAQKEQIIASNLEEKRAIANKWKRRLLNFGTSECTHYPRLLKFGTQLGWWRDTTKHGAPRWLVGLARRNAGVVGAELMGAEVVYKQPDGKEYRIVRGKKIMAEPEAGPEAVKAEAKPGTPGAKPSAKDEAGCDFPITRRQSKTAQALHAARTAPHLSASKTASGDEIGWGNLQSAASKIFASLPKADPITQSTSYKNMIQGLKTNGVNIDRGSSWDRPTYKKAQDIAQKAFGSAKGIRALKFFRKGRRIKAVGETTAGDDFPVLRHQSKTAMPYQATRTAPPLTASKTAAGLFVGDEADQSFPVLRHQSKTAMPYQATRTAPPLTASKTAAGLFVGEDIPPPIPGEPADVNVAVTASAKSLGVPPAVSASMIAARNAGEKQASKAIEEAAKIYQAAQKGDSAAKAQIAKVAADAKTGYGPAMQKAAALSAAVGIIKGRTLYAERKQAEKENKKAKEATKAVAAAAPAASATSFEVIPPPSSGFRLFRFSPPEAC